MILILGGYAQGRTAFAMKTFGLTNDDVFDAAKNAYAEWDGQRLILHAEELVTQWLAEGKDLQEAAKQAASRWQNVIVILQEVGCGLVPVSPEERRWREAVGRAGCVWAAQADAVYRVCCGIGKCLKESI